MYLVYVILIMIVVQICIVHSIDADSKKFLLVPTYIVVEVVDFEIGFLWGRGTLILCALSQYSV